MKHRTKRMKRLHTKADLGETVDSCIPCHDHIHAILSEKELANNYNTVEAILAHPEMQKFVAWVASKPSDFVVHSKRAGRRR